MATFRLPSGVCLSTDNSSIAQQYLKYGAVEVGEIKPVDEQTQDEKKPKKAIKK